MAWHPWTLTAFHDFWTYPFVLLLSVALLSIMFRILRQPSGQWSCPLLAAMGGILFFWEWTRMEDPLVYGTSALFAAIAWALSRQEADPASWRRRLALLALPIVMVFSLSTCVRIANYFEYGVYAKSRMTAPGLTALVKALYRIKPERNLRYAPVTRLSLQMACQASPTLRQFQTALLDPRAHDTRIGERMTRVPGEVGPWLDLLLIATMPSDSRDGNQTMLTAASEIDDAIRNGQLPGRHASYPLDPNWRMWLPDFVPSIVTCLRSASSFRRWESWEYEITGSPFVGNDLDEGANRRGVASGFPMLMVEGSVPSPQPCFDSVAVVDQRGELLAASPLITNFLDGGMVFNMRSPLPKESSGYNLVFYQNGKPKFSERCHTCAWWATNQFVTVSNTASMPGLSDKIDYSYRLATAEPGKRSRLASWAPRTVIFCKLISWSAAIATLLVVLFGEIWDNVRFRLALACLLLVAGWLLGRAVFYGFINATMSYPIDRYMLCASPLFVLILVLAAAVSAALLRKGYIRTVSGQSMP